MKVINRINNNVVLVTQGEQKMIVTGKGVGFQVYPGDIVNEDFVEQRFVLEQDSSNDYYTQLLRDIPMEYLNAAKAIVELAEQELTKTLPLNFAFTLADHIYFSVQRQKQGIPVNHLLSDEIKVFYPKEYQIGHRALALIRAQYQFDVDASEDLSIALHLVNAAGGLSDRYDVMDMTETMKAVVDQIEQVLSINLDVNSAAFSRFIVHLRFYLIRQLNLEIDDSMSKELIDIVRGEYPRAFECAELITDYVDSKYHYYTHDSEKLYLTLHINRLLNNKGRRNYEQ